VGHQSGRFGDPPYSPVVWASVQAGSVTRPTAWGSTPCLPSTTARRSTPCLPSTRPTVCVRHWAGRLPEAPLKIVPSLMGSEG
jgi:hypothetical protein